MACPEVACRRITACSGQCSAALMPSVGQGVTHFSPDGQDAARALLHSCALPRGFSLFVRRDPGMSQLGVGLTGPRRAARILPGNLEQMPCGERTISHAHPPDRPTNPPEASPTVARRGRRVPAVRGEVCHPDRRTRGHGLRDDWLSRRRVGDSRVVAVLQPGALVRAAGRHHADDHRVVRYVAHRPRVDCWGCDGDVALLLGDPRPEPRLGGLGRSQPSPLQRTSARLDGRHHSARLRNIYARAHQRRHL